MRYFCAHVVSSTGLADDPGPGSGAWIRSALLGGRRAVRADMRGTGLAVAVRARAAAGGGTAPRRDRLARRGAVLAAAVRDRSGQAGGGAGRGEGGSPRGAGGAVATRRGRAAEAGMDARKRSTIASLRLEVETGRTRIGELEAELAKLRASRAVHAKARFGRKSERRERAGSDRPRGQQAGAAGHGRTPRPGLEKRAEVHHPAADERVCSDCGKPYVANGSDTSELIEVSVQAHTRVIARPRWRRSVMRRWRRRAAGSLGAAGGAPVREHALRE